MKRFTLMLMLGLPFSSFGQNIQKSEKTPVQGCKDGGQIVAAIFRVSPGARDPVMEDTACTDSPVAITGMKIRGDGSVWISFKNLDKERSATAIGYLVTVFDDQNRRIVRTALWGRPLNKPVAPGAEMELQNEEPHTRLENITAGRYLVQFNSVLFTNMSEWQMRRRCVLAKESGLIKCDSVEQ